MPGLYCVSWPSHHSPTVVAVDAGPGDGLCSYPDGCSGDPRPAHRTGGWNRGTSRAAGGSVEGGRPATRMPWCGPRLWPSPRECRGHQRRRGVGPLCPRPSKGRRRRPVSRRRVRRSPGPPRVPMPPSSTPSIAAGRPLTLPEAIELAFRLQPRLRAQLESIAQARGRSEIVSSTFLPTVAGSYERGRVRPGRRAANRSASTGCRHRDSTSCRASGPCPSASTSGPATSWPSSRSSGCILDFGRRLGRLRAGEARRSTSPGSRPIAPSRRWPTRSPSPTTAS